MAKNSIKTPGQQATITFKDGMLHRIDVQAAKIGESRSGYVLEAARRRLLRDESNAAKEGGEK